MTSRVYSVDTLDLSLVLRDGRVLVVFCTGRAAGTGWRGTHLAPFIYVSPPLDGVLDVDLLATPPSGQTPALPIPAPISAELTLRDVDVENYWGLNQPLTGVRCHAAANTKTVSLQEARRDMPHQTSFHALDEQASVRPSFARDIVPLFRSKDWRDLQQRHPELSTGTKDIAPLVAPVLDSLRNGSWPEDGPWPSSDIELLNAWLAAGSPD